MPAKLLAKMCLFVQNLATNLAAPLHLVVPVEVADVAPAGAVLLAVRRDARRPAHHAPNVLG